MIFPKICAFKDKGVCFGKFGCLQYNPGLLQVEISCIKKTFSGFGFEMDFLSSRNMVCGVEASPVVVYFESFPIVYFLVTRKSFWGSSGSNGLHPKALSLQV